MYKPPILLTPMSKDPDLNRDVQNELNQIFPEKMNTTEFYARTCGRMQGAISNAMMSGNFCVHAAKNLMDSLEVIDDAGSTEVTNNRLFISELKFYIKKHDKTSH